MTDQSCFINGVWRSGSGDQHASVQPADGATVWTGPQASPADVQDAVSAARAAQPQWESTPLSARQAIVETFARLVDKRGDALADIISAETGKPRWEAATEVASVIGKVRLSIDAHADRTPTIAVSESAHLAHRALGVIGVLGPFNFPAHLPNGQIIPALLAGNTVVYKPSEQTPAVAAAHVELLAAAGVPAGVVNLVAGGRDAGAMLVDSDVDGIAFTGSVNTGRALHRALANRPEVLLALEMGGNNPLVVADVEDIDSVVNLIIRSAFITAGQRCTCARRLYIPRTSDGESLLAELVETVRRLRIGAPDDIPEPFAGPVISAAAADHVRSHVAAMIGAGAVALTGPGEPVPGTGFVEPTMFGPVLVVQHYDDLDEAFAEAANTAYGLAAGLIGTNPDDFTRFQQIVKAGLVNWNAPTTGASGRLPFGGVGASGNHRPAGWTAADFCAYPVATVMHPSAKDTTVALRGLNPPQSSGEPADNRS